MASLLVVMVICYNIDYSTNTRTSLGNILAIYIMLVAYQKRSTILITTNLLLVYMGDYFNIIKEKQKIRIDYSLYSMMIGSVDFKKITETFNESDVKDIIGNYAELRSSLNFAKANQIPIKNEDIYTTMLKELVSCLYKPLQKCLYTGHLSNRQLSCISELFIHEFNLHLSSGRFNWNDAKTYIPSVLYDQDLKEHIRSLLLKDKKHLSQSLQREMNNLKLTTTITMIKDIPYTVYHITSTLDFLLIDLQKYLTGKRTVKECEYCERLYFPAMRSSAKYCRLPHEDTDKTCDYLMHHTPKDDIEALYIYAKRQQAKFRDYYSNVDNYGYIFLNTVYNEWKTDCDKQYAMARRTGDISTFKKWVENTKFISKYLKELHHKNSDSE